MTSRHAPEEQRTSTERTRTLPAAGAAVLVGAAALLGWTSWEAAVPDLLAHRVFLLACLVAVGVLALRLVTPLPGRTVRAVTLGALVGAAVGTTPWQALAEVFWYQLWWSVPLAVGLALMLREPSTPSAGT
ncbi:hypothetical protein GCM10007079_40790 [Nocardiopsis terrae]|uniref:Uncharacterized protein n=1 Tax=Nocardiopsis terrae TaxID=372655 RepID=A0ABR9HM02_9ACTN|nr:hypothetical protein [Nocardiopsis terrae]MBE1460042.1 hypothetical protein [Nocardiopsis terrae]GHC92500.1 hypothetical protein GCM10007079_40790 [Nocardiopsis terrae]